MGEISLFRSKYQTRRLLTDILWSVKNAMCIKAYRVMNDRNVCLPNNASCLTIFSTSLSVAAYLRSDGGSMLESTGSHGRGVERRVPEMRCMRNYSTAH